MTRAEGSWAVSPGVRSRMQRQRSRDTGPEMRLRRALHAQGLRFRVHRQLLPGLRRRADIVFGPARVVVDVRGCYWHGCPDHYRLATSNEHYWHPKIAGNRARDQETERLLAESGWLVLVVWEHEDCGVAAERVIQAVRARKTAR
jgi:DNA mismatch endonuclease, patch repair protein